MTPLIRKPWALIALTLLTSLLNLQTAQGDFWYMQNPRDHVLDTDTTVLDNLDSARRSEVYLPNLSVGNEASDNFNGIRKGADKLLHVRWWGAQANQLTSSFAQFHFAIYAEVRGPEGSTPSIAPIATWTRNAASNVDDGFIANSIGETFANDYKYYEYNTRLVNNDLILDENTNYWISIVNIDPVAPSSPGANDWLWLPAANNYTANEAIRNGLDSVFGTPDDWTVSTGIFAQGRAFQIDVQGIPEPTSMAMLSLVAGIGAYRRRRNLRNSQR